MTGNKRREPVTIRTTCVFAALASLPTIGVAQENDDRLQDIAHFFEGADVVSGPEIVECTLSEGAKADCFSITLTAAPQGHAPGPWCPTTVSDGAEAGGIWFLDGETVDVDGDFITRLSEIYGDSNWQLFDPDTGKVRYTGTLEDCEAAARPDVDPAYQNYCVQCLPETLPETPAMTYVIPLEPVAAEAAGRTGQNGSGLAHNGVRLDGPAPVDAILGAYTIAPFDDCGGHVNPHVGYHYHAVTDCLDGVAQTDGAGDHGARIGIAMDGHAILPHLMADGSAPADLDQCNGHADETDGYHYHAGAPGSNAILGCLTAQAGCTLNDAEGTCDASAQGRGPGGPGGQGGPEADQ